MNRSFIITLVAFFFLSCAQNALIDNNTKNSFISFLTLGDQTGPTVDTEAPVIGLFMGTGKNPTIEPSVPVTITGSDNVGITGWMITESSTPPSSADSGWLSSPPTTYNITGYGVHDLHVWVRDLAGNVSSLNPNSHFTIDYRQGIYLIRTGQTACYDEAGALISPCTGTGQDGELQRGLAWPSPRFTNNGLTITDNLTGLIWVADANHMSSAPYSAYDTDGTPGDGRVTWQHALDYINILNTDSYGSRNDWRLPNILELMSFMNYGSNNMSSWLASFGFSNLATLSYWSSTTYMNSTDYAWSFIIPTGQKSNLSKGLQYYVWAVASTSTILPKTGQTACYDATGALISPCTGTGHDGELQRGVTWPSPRFTDNLDGTITDNLTGLMWTSDANIMKTRDPSFDTDAPTLDGAVTWQHALDYMNYLNVQNYCGYNDWRLPNYYEILSIHNHGADISWLTTSGFTNADNLTQAFWTSTTSETAPSYAHVFNAPYGISSYYFKTTTSYFVWPVRGGY